MKSKLIPVSLVVLLALILSSCNASMYVKRNKAEDYHKKITDNLTVLLTHSEGERYTEWSNGFKGELISEFGQYGVTVEITEFPVVFGMTTLSAKDIHTPNPNGLVLIIAEERIVEEGKSITSEFSFTLFDETMDRNVWKTTIPAVIKGGLGSIEGRGKKSVKYLFDLLKKDGLI